METKESLSRKKTKSSLGEEESNWVRGPTIRAKAKKENQMLLGKDINTYKFKSKVRKKNTKCI